MSSSFLRYIPQFLPPAPLFRAIFLGLLLIGIFLRVAGLTWGIPDSGNQSSIYHDEGHVLSFVLKGHEDFEKDFGEYEIVRPVYLFRLVGRPLFALGNALGINDGNTRIFEIAALRAVTSLFGIIGLLAIYALGKQIASWKAGLWAMSFLTFMPAHWYYSQILKGDLMVATLFTLILLCAIRIARTGDTWAYIAGALVLGAGVSFKTTTVMAAPVLLLAHLLFAWKQKRWSALVSKNSLAFLVFAAASFAVLYPYPFYNFEQYWHFIENPSLQHLSPRFLVSPAEYIATLKQYYSPTRPFFEMIMGKFLLWTFVPSVLVVLGMTAYQLMGKRRTELLLVMALFILFFHSLTFSDALDERYILPFAPFAALFPALVITGFGAAQKTYQKNLGMLLGLLLVAGTAAITWVTFPPFALEEPRKQAVNWVRSQAPADSAIAQATQQSRWALVFDAEKFRNTSFLYGPPADRHVAALANPDYVIIQQEPWNYDHTFRDELVGINVAKELQPFLDRYQHKQTFGKVPRVFGWRIPQTLGTPVIHVYSSPTNSLPGEQPRTVSPPNQRRPIQNGSFIPVAGALTPGSYLRFQIRGEVNVPPDREGEIYFGVSAQNNFSLPTLPRRLEEPEVIEGDGGPVLMYRMPMSTLRENQKVSVAIHFPHSRQAVFYAGSGERLFHMGQASVPDTFGIYVFSLVPEGEAPPPGSFGIENVLQGKIPL